MKQIRMVGILIPLCLMATGCPSESDRLADFAERATHEQANQNLEMTSLNKELVKPNQQIQTERKELNNKFSELDLERQQMSRQRRSGLVWAESFRFLATVLAAIMPLFLCAFLIWAATQNVSDQQLINEVLISELSSDNPRLIACSTSDRDQNASQLKQQLLTDNGEQDVTYRDDQD